MWQFISKLNEWMVVKYLHFLFVHNSKTKQYFFLLARQTYTGLSQSLWAFWTPAPHVLEQADHSLHEPQPPFIFAGWCPTGRHSPRKHHWRLHSRSCHQMDYIKVSTSKHPDKTPLKSEHIPAGFVLKTQYTQQYWWLIGNVAENSFPGGSCFQPQTLITLSY